MVLEELVVVRYEQTYTYKASLFVTGLLTHRMSFQGSREGSESGEGILADEIDKLQVVMACFSNIASQWGSYVDILIPQNGNASPCRRLSNAETNVISNSVSHGVEAPQVRLRSGKDDFESV